MGSGSVNKTTTSPQDIIDYLDDLFSYALSIGMTYDQYWYQEPKLIKSYVQAEEYRQIRRNQDKWLQGLYNHIALNVSLSNAFNKHANSKYLEKPIALSQKEKEIEEATRVERITKKLDKLVNKKLG